MGGSHKELPFLMSIVIWYVRNVPRFYMINKKKMVKIYLTLVYSKKSCIFATRIKSNFLYLK
jgi:hypothetical protein